MKETMIAVGNGQRVSKWRSVSPGNPETSSFRAAYPPLAVEQFLDLHECSRIVYSARTLDSWQGNYSNVKSSCAERYSSTITFSLTQMEQA